MTLPVRTLFEIVRDAAEEGARPFLTFVHAEPDSALVEERRSHAALLANGRRLAGAFRAAGLEPGDRFALLMRNRAAFVDAMVASEIAGTEFVAIDPRIRGDKLADMLRFAACRGVIACPEGWANLRPVLGLLPGVEWVWTVDDMADRAARPLDEVVASASPIRGEPARFDQTMQLLYTSSTTGDAKAIRVPHGRFAAVAAWAEVFGLTATDRLYTGLSLTHGNAQFITLGSALALNLPLVISRQFTKSRLWEILAHYRCTVFNTLGGMTSAIFAEPPAALDRAHDVRMVLSAGMPKALWRDFEQRFGVRVFEFFATAEGGLLVNPPGVGPVGSVGKAAAGTRCEVLDAHDAICPSGRRGELCFQNSDGTVAPVNYLANEAASTAKTRGGWFRSGDIGWKDAEGWVHFSHRAGRSVRRNGDFVDIAAMEALIAGLQGVDDVHVYGVRTAASAPGEREVVAAIVPAEWPGDAAAIMTICLDRLGSIGTPNLIQIVRAIPKTASEKPQERHLVEMINERSCVLHDKSGPTEIEANEGREDSEQE